MAENSIGSGRERDDEAERLEALKEAIQKGYERGYVRFEVLDDMQAKFEAFRQAKNAEAEAEKLGKASMEQVDGEGKRYAITRDDQGNWTREDGKSTRDLDAEEERRAFAAIMLRGLQERGVEKDGLESADALRWAHADSRDFRQLADPENQREAARTIAANFERQGGYAEAMLDVGPDVVQTAVAQRDADKQHAAQLEQQRAAAEQGYEATRNNPAASELEMSAAKEARKDAEWQASRPNVAYHVYSEKDEHGTRQDFTNALEAAKAFHEMPSSERPTVERVTYAANQETANKLEVVARTTEEGKQVSENDPVLHAAFQQTVTEERKARATNLASELEGNADRVQAEALNSIRERGLRFADDLQETADRVEARMREEALARGRAAADELGSLADRVEARTHEAGLERGRAAADEMGKLADKLEARDAEVSGAATQQREATRALARADLENLHEIHNPAMLDDVAEILHRKMANGVYRAEFERVDPDAARAIDMLAKDGNTFDKSVADKASTTIRDVDQETMLAARVQDRQEALRLLHADQYEHRGESLADQYKQQQAQQQEQEASFEPGIPAALRKRFLHHEDKFYLRDEGNKLAFEDKGKRLITDSNDPEIARSMIELAVSKQWSTLTLRGSDEFKREAWLHASLKGLDVYGYNPKKADIARLEDLRSEQSRGATNSIDHTPERAATRQGQAAERPAERTVVDETREAPREYRQAADVLRQIVLDQGGSKEAADLVAREASKRVYLGKVEDHGKAPYDNNPKNEESYFVKVQTSRGERTVWGADLERAVTDGGVKKGDQIALIEEGRKAVTVQTPIRDEQGNITGTKSVDTHRNTWSATKLEQISEVARDKLQARSDVVDKVPAIKVYDHTAARPHRHVPQPAQKRENERARN